MAEKNGDPKKNGDPSKTEEPALTLTAVAKLPLKRRVQIVETFEDDKGTARQRVVEKLVAHEVVVPVTDKAGNPIVVRDKDGRSSFRTVAEPIAAKHLIGFRVAGNTVYATTVDGVKLEAAIA
jgi:hypothetical protein